MQLLHNKFKSLVVWLFPYQKEKKYLQMKLLMAGLGIYSHNRNNRKFNDLFRQDNIQHLNIYLVIDEAHCILEWGEEFRPDYKRLCQLRSVFSCTVLALSATITSVGQKAIMKNLWMENCKTVMICPTKDNIQLIVLKDARSVSFYPYNRSQILQCVEYTK